MRYSKNVKDQIKIYAKRLRKNLTPAEKILWQELRKKQIKNKRFYRQVIILGYIVDFYCPSSNLIIEIDGSYHNNNECKKYDKLREERLKAKNFKIIRFCNNEIFYNLTNILKKIKNCQNKI